MHITKCVCVADDMQYAAIGATIPNVTGRSIAAVPAHQILQHAIVLQQFCPAAQHGHGGQEQPDEQSGSQQSQCRTTHRSLDLEGLHRQSPSGRCMWSGQSPHVTVVSAFIQSRLPCAVSTLQKKNGLAVGTRMAPSIAEPLLFGTGATKWPRSSTIHGVAEILFLQYYGLS